MAFDLLEADESDMFQLVTVFSEAFGRYEPLVNMSMPEHWTEAGRQTGAERWKRVKRTDRYADYIKAVDRATGAIAGYAKWNFYKNVIPNLHDIDGGLPDHYDKPEDKEDLLRTFKGFLDERLAAIDRTQGNIAVLDTLVIRPEYQRRGIGDALVAWGIKKTDELGVEAVVESSVFGKRLYEKHGFVFVKDVDLILPEAYKEYETKQFAWLVRPKTAHA